MNTSSDNRFFSPYQQQPSYYQPTSSSIDQPIPPATSFPAQTTFPNQSQPPSPANFRKGNLPKAPINNTQLLLEIYAPDDRVKVKTENAQKYNMRVDSPVYYYPGKFLVNVLFKYPEEFPIQANEEIKNTVAKIQMFLMIFQNSLISGAIYWAMVRRYAWFKLTSMSPPNRFGLGILCFCMMNEIRVEEEYYYAEKAFVYNKQFQAALEKQIINQSLKDRTDVVS